jgi:hypothetical protein
MMRFSRMSEPVHNEPSEAEAVDGDVALMGPDGVSVMLTPEAAAETSDRLLHSAMAAEGQRSEAKRQADERRDRIGS